MLGEVGQCSRCEAPGSYSKFCIMSGFFGIAVCGRLLNIDVDMTNRLKDELPGESGTLPGIRPTSGAYCQRAIVKASSTEVKSRLWVDKNSFSVAFLKSTEGVWLRNTLEDPKGDRAIVSVHRP